MPKRAVELTQSQINKLTSKFENRPTFFPVGGVAGLHWQITPGGSGSWALRVTIGGKRRWVGLGAYPEVRLGDARDRAREIKAQIAAGVDPLAERHAAKAALRREAGMTFGQAVEEYLSAKLDEFRNEKHKKQWRSTLDTYAAPVIGKMQVKDLTVQDVLAVLSPIWTDKTETASRLRGRIENVLAWSTVHGYREGDNPARWKGNLDAIMPKPGKVARKGNHPAIKIDDAPRWFKALRQRGGTGSRALEFIALTAVRSQEVRGARWSEIDLDAAMWTIPADRMKMDREHRVPLTEAAVALLKALPRGKNPLVFPAVRGGELSDATLSATMKRLHAADVASGGAGFVDAKSKRPAVPHGLRSTFRDWAAERTDFPGDMAEIALAHRVGNAVEAAYRRGDMVEKRRGMMKAWAEFLTKS